MLFSLFTPARAIATLFLLSLANVCFGAPAKIDQEGELIIEIALSDTTKLAEGFVIYPDGEDWLFPLGELAEGLGIALTVNAKEKTAKGFILQEDRTFELELKGECRASVDGEWRKFSCDDTVIYEDEIFVRRKLVEKWFPVNMVVNPFKARASVIPREKLPVQLQREREAEASRATGGGVYDPGYPVQALSHSVFDFPFVDLQLGVNRAETGPERVNEMSYDIQASGELFESDASLSLNGNQRKLNSGRLRLARKDPNGLGALKLKEVQYFDITTPPVPLITLGKEARGFVASSFPLTAPLTFESTILEGPLPAGWEVFLYRNGTLIERKTSDGTGRYRFTNVLLFYGLNTVRLAFFGNRGERREEIRNYNISNDLVKPGARDYRVSLGILEDTRQRLSMQYSGSVYDYFTTSFGIVSDNNPSQTYATVGLLGVNELFLFNTTCAVSDRGGKACEWGQQFTIFGASLASKYTRLFDFSSEIFNPAGTDLMQESQISVQLSHMLPINPVVGLAWEFTKRNFVDGSDKSSVRNNVTILESPFQLTNALTYEFGSAARLFGTWELSGLTSYTRLLVGSDYTDRQITSVKAEAQVVSPDAYSLTSKITYDFVSKLPAVSLNASKFFDEFALGLATSFSSSNNYSAGLTFAMGITRDSRSGAIFPNYRPGSQTGSASILVFIDKNRDGIRDPDEVPVPDILVSVSPRRIEEKTNAKGIVYVPRIDPYIPTDVSISLRDFADPYLRPGRTGARIYARPGKCAEVDFPMFVVGEIDGEVTLSSGGKLSPIRRVPIQLVDAQGNILYRQRTDSDGIFLFESIPAGTYRVRVSPVYLKNKGLDSVPKERVVTIMDTGSAEPGQDFALVPQ